MRLVTIHHAGLDRTTQVPESRLPHLSPGWKVVRDPKPELQAPVRKARPSKRAASRTTARKES